MSGNGKPPTSAKRIEKIDDFKFPPRPKGRYVIKVEYALERVITWEAIKLFHGVDNGNVKERDRENAIGTRNAIVYGCDVDRVTGAIGFAPGWMAFESGAQVDHLLKCFEWQLSDEGPGIELENMVIANEVIKALKVLSAKAEADKPKPDPAEKNKPAPRRRSR